MRVVHAIELRGLSKSYGANVVLDRIDWSVAPGEIHVLAGANGAGKSTLLGVLSGSVRPDRGEVFVGGASHRFASPRDARRAGVAVIHQELSLVPSMSVVDNVFLGRELRSRAEQRTRARKALADLGLDLDVDRAVESLPVSQQQLVEIAKALTDVGGDGARVLLMDEPTSALHAAEAEHLFRRIGALAEGGCAIVYVSHRMEEIHRLADRITVLRDGALAVTAPPSELPRDALVRAMLGRSAELSREGVTAIARAGKTRLVVQSLSVGRALRDVSLEVHPGEIVGLAGLAGAGCGALLHAIFGDGPRLGRVLVDGVALPADPRASIAGGVVLVPADRKSSGLTFGASVERNAVLSSLDRLSRFGFVDDRRARAEVAEIARATSLRGALDGEVDRLSGGNQQKVTLARAILARPRVYLLDEPTRGVDVGAKAEIHALVRKLSREGAAVLFASSELEELLALADRIVVLHRGAVARAIDGGDATREAILSAAMGA